MLASFNNKPPAPATAPSSAPPNLPSAEASGGDDEDFEASLVEGMESLLRQLAGDHPPGPMPDLAPGEQLLDGKGKPAGPRAGTATGKPKDMSAEEEEAAWQKAIDTLLSGEGLSALGLEDKKGKSRAAPNAGAGPGTASAAGDASFEETIRKTMESLNAGGEASKSSGKTPDLAELLKQLSENPGALDGLGEGDEDGDDPLGGLLDGMMSQLMTREILEEPMSELASKVCPAQQLGRTPG